MQSQTPQQVQSPDVQKKMREMKLNPFDFYRAMRTSHPVYYNEMNKWWEVYRYNDVLYAVNEPAIFSSEVFATPAMRDPHQVSAGSILNMDSPRHRRLRFVINQAFVPRANALAKSQVITLIQERLDTLAPYGQMDIITDFAGTLPLAIIVEMLGLPQQDRPQLKTWTQATSTASPEGTAHVFEAMSNYFRQVVKQRRIHMGSDLISTLLDAEYEGQRLTEEEVISFCILLLFAGNETLTNLIGNAFLCFDSHPEAMKQIQADLSLLPNALEEVLRYLSPVQLLVRVATKDTQLGDKEIKAGQVVFLCNGSANRDEEQFAQADVFDIRRAPNRHIAFGYSEHFCLGAPLARYTARTAIEMLLTRFTQIQRVRPYELEPVENMFVYGVKTLPVTFQVR